LHLLASLGFNDFFAQSLHALKVVDVSLVLGRIAQQQKKAYFVLGEKESRWCELAGRFYHHTTAPTDFPAVGDWVLLRARPHEDRGVIHKLLERQSVLLRPDSEASRSSTDQILAANVDIAFLVSSLNLNLEHGGLRRLERYLTLVTSAGVKPVILLTKADLCSVKELPRFLREVQAIAPNVPVHAVSCLDNTGIETVAAYLTLGKTGVLLGSSGVGKSTLVNYLAKEDIQDMMEVRELDDKGRHCTASRNLIRIAPGDDGEPRGMLIDTPGLRGLMLGGDNDQGVGITFEDMDQLSAQCRFTNCRHVTEPGCAIKRALEGGTITPERVASYLKLMREAAAANKRSDTLAQRREGRPKKSEEDHR
jgi:ribosome biogenesis GTPase